MRVHSRATVALIAMLAAGVAAAQSSDGKRIVAPGDVIALEVGVWDAVVTSRPRTPGGKPTTAIGVQVNELRSGGMWMLNRMSVNGGGYEGTGIWGFDAKTGRYSGAWVDNGNAHIRMDDGIWDPDTNTMTWTAEVERPEGQKLRVRATSTFAGNTRTYRSYAIIDGGEVALSTVVFTRRPDSDDREH